MKDFSLRFGAVIAILLLLLYGSSVVWMGVQVVKAGGQNVEFPSGVVTVVTMVGGLISALVIAKLAETPPGQSPTVRFKTAAPPPPGDSGEVKIAVAYIAAWLLCGLGALIVGGMLYPEANATLHDIGTTWLGLAVTSGYAYFGIEPKT